MRTAALSLDQAPPIASPLSFFATAPVAMMAAGALLLSSGASPLRSSWMPEALALTHLGTLGVLAMVMFGALYQMVPVVAGTSVPLARLSHGVHVLLVAGTGGLVWGLATAGRPAHGLALVALTLAVLLFLGPMAVALVRAPTRSATVDGMRLAVASLATVAGLGLYMAFKLLTGVPPVPRPLWLQVHLTVGLLGWVGGLITAVSWQVLPMFDLAPPVDERAQRAVLWSIAAGVLLALAALGANASIAEHTSPTRVAAIAALPAALAVWVVHPVLVLRSLARRRRPRTDASMRFWQVASGVALLVALCAAALPFVSDPRLPVLFGWLVIWGWAALIVHGMLARIVPFLWWFHRFSALVGRVAVPSMKDLLPDAHVRVDLALHVAALLGGATTIATGSDLLARITGVLMIATAVALLAAIGRVLANRPPPVPASLEIRQHVPPYDGSGAGG